MLHLLTSSRALEKLIVPQLVTQLPPFKIRNFIIVFTRASREYNIKTDLYEIEWVGVYWIIWRRIGTDALVCFCEHGDEQSGYIKGREFLG
jgi:hypothetical protein